MTPAPLPYHMTTYGTGPMVMVYIGDDDPKRGESVNALGLANNIAQKLGGRAALVNKAQLSSFLHERGDPTIIFERDFKDGGMTCIDWRSKCKTPPALVIPNANIDLGPGISGVAIARRFLQEKDLVPHHLTPHIFAEKKQEFLSLYPDLPRPLIAAMITDPDIVMELQAPLARALQSYDQASVFVCSGRDISSTQFKNHIHQLQANLFALDLTQRITLIGYDYDRESAITGSYNPYIGLLAAANHVIVSGDSKSTISETLATGKRPIVHDLPLGIPSRLAQRGLAVSFNTVAADRRLPASSECAPVDITSRLAEKIISTYLHTTQTTPQLQHVKHAATLS